MLSNRSIQRAAVIPVLAYPDVHQAAAWLCDAFGFTIRMRIGNHRVQLNVGDGAVTVREMRPNEVNAALGLGCSVTVRIEDADTHCKRAKDHGALITQEPVTQPYGERQYNARDFAGYSWTFSQSVADVHPQDWGATAEQL
ncbi:MAG TPA: VOC family protein [Candidatus Acidoferrum sp.]|nr:VOC family protein [Candidatus Acidoferrum sp.]